MFTRGASQKIVKGYFPWEKLDLLLERYWVALWRLFGVGKPDPAHNQARAEPQTVVGGASVTLKRLTLKQWMGVHGIRGLFKETELHEPHFDSVILVHRRLRSEEKGRTALRMREFQNVSYGDLEACFPGVVVGMPPFDAVKFWIQIVLLVSFLLLNIGAIWENEDELEYSTLLLLGILLVGLASRIVSAILYYVSTITYYERHLEQWLLGKRVGQGPLVVSKLCDDVCFQEERELILGYFFIQNFGPLQLQDLDTQVESFLRTEFNENLDFDAEDAVAKLMRLGLVQKDGNGAFVALVHPTEWVQFHPVEHLGMVSLH